MRQEASIQSTTSTREKPAESLYRAARQQSESSWDTLDLQFEGTHAALSSMETSYLSLSVLPRHLNTVCQNDRPAGPHILCHRSWRTVSDFTCAAAIAASIDCWPLKKAILILGCWGLPNPCEPRIAAYEHGSKCRAPRRKIRHRTSKTIQ